ncbi:MAG: RDD family protein [Phycisphaerae bacterium]|nr:RDD family protein [Phycisphaerae bacterium]
MNSRSLSFLLLCIGLILSGAPALGAATAADERGGYFFLPTPPLGFTLMTLPADAPPGTITRVINLGAAPDLCAARDGTLIMFYRPSGTAAAGPRAWMVRRVHPAPTSEPVESDPLPPLITEGTPIGLALTNRSVLALVESHNRMELVELEGSEWKPATVPERFNRERSAQLFTLSGDAALFQNRTDSSAALWRQSGDPARPSWSEIEFPAVPDAALHGIANQVIALPRRGATDAAVMLVRPTGITPIFALTGLKPDHWVVPGPSAISVVESDGGLLPRLSCRVISPSGAVLYEGWARTSGAIGHRDLAFLAVALASLFSAVLIFVFRPESSRRETITLPRNTALAGPATRALAGVIDAGAAWLLAGLGLGIFNSNLGAWLLPTGEESSLTLLAALPIAVVAGTVLEFMIGRSFGKVLTGCRVVTTSGTRISMTQAAARNLVRFLCPPLGMAWMIQTPDRTFGLFGTIVVIDLGDDPGVS